MLHERREQAVRILACRLGSLPEACSCALCGESIPARSDHWRVLMMVDREVVVRRVHCGPDCAGARAMAGARRAA